MDKSETRMGSNAKTTEKVAIAIVCAAGCLAIEALAYVLGWTKTLADAAMNWVAYTAVTTIVVILLTKRKSSNTEQQ